MSTASIQSKRTSPSSRLPQSMAAAGGPSVQAVATVLRRALPIELKAHGTRLSKGDLEAMADALAQQVAELVVRPSSSKARKAQASSSAEWITTQEAANRCGFSRPFVAALLDSGDYKGQVFRTTGGHRKVLAGEFEALMAEASAKAPKTLLQARKAVDLTHLDTGSAQPSAARKQSRERAKALAKKLGITA